MVLEAARSHPLSPVAAAGASYADATGSPAPGRRFLSL